MKLLVRETFEAAHSLPRVGEGHKCASIHGHSYKVFIALLGDVDPETGWVIDFGSVKRAFIPLKEHLDHHVLNEIEGLENPTAENLARWIYEQLDTGTIGALLDQVTVMETENCSVTYAGEDAQ